MDRELKLNSIDRYVKFSPHFVLEEHGHCEVPAGCGGVVLRWRDPAAAVPVRLQLWIRNATEYEVELDGARPHSSRPLLSPGTHVLTIRAVPAAGEAVLLLFSANADIEGDPMLLLSRPSASWRWSGTEPPTTAWSRQDYDDAGWSPMVAGDLTAEQANEYPVRSLVGRGASPLTAAPPDSQLWIRSTFVVPVER
jgi:hypothetical protein